MSDRRKPLEQISAPPTVMIEIAAAATAEARFDILVEIVEKLAVDLHTVKGNLAANTYMTKEVADGQAQLKESVDRIDFSVLTDFLEAISSMKGGIKVLGWLERPAKWIAAVGGAAAIIYSIWSHK